MSAPVRLHVALLRGVNVGSPVTVRNRRTVLGIDRLASLSPKPVGASMSGSRSL